VVCGVFFARTLATRPLARKKAEQIIHLRLDLYCNCIFKLLLRGSKKRIKPLDNLVLACDTAIMKNLSVMKLNKKAVVPVRQTEGSVGYDIAACLEREVTINPGETKKIGSGVAIALDEGYAAFIYARSGLGINKGIVPANCVGVIDSDYRGEIIVGLRNFSKEPFKINHGDRIAQMVITKCETPEITLCNALDETVRNTGGFGSTG